MVTVEGETYIWPHGQSVQVFGFVDYTRRLSGQTREAHRIRSSPARPEEKGPSQQLADHARVRALQWAAAREKHPRSFP